MTRLKFSLFFLVFSYFLIGACNDGKNQIPMHKYIITIANEPLNAIVIQPTLLDNKNFTTGTLLANEEVELLLEIPGRVTGIFFTEGNKVKKEAFNIEACMRRLFEIKGISKEEYDKAVNALVMIKTEKKFIESQLAKT